MRFCNDEHRSDTADGSHAYVFPTPEEMSRISPIRGTNPKDGKEVDRKPVTTDPLTAYVFKTVADPFAGKLSIFRVYSGVLKADSTVLNATSGAKERVGQIILSRWKEACSSGVGQCRRDSSRR